MGHPVFLVSGLILIFCHKIVEFSFFSLIFLLSLWDTPAPNSNPAIKNDMLWQTCLSHQWNNPVAHPRTPGALTSFPGNDGTKLLMVQCNTRTVKHDKSKGSERLAVTNRIDLFESTVSSMSVQSSTTKVRLGNTVYLFTVSRKTVFQEAQQTRSDNLLWEHQAALIKIQLHLL